MTEWINFQQFDWLAAVLLHSLWIGGVITVLSALLLHFGGIKNAHSRYLVGVGSMALFVLSIGLLSIYLIPGAESEIGAVLTFEDTSAIVQEAAADSALSWLTILKSYSTVFLQAWFIGMTFLLLRMIGGYQYLIQIRRKANDHVPEAWVQSINSIRSQWNMHGEIRILASNHIDMPMVFGHIKPALLLPVSMLSGLDQDQLEAIFAHELAHIRRNDYLVHLAQTVIEAIFFFNPFIWWLSKFINQEREQCCDDLAVAYCSNPISYAEALSGLEEYRSMMLAMGLANGKQSLLLRIRRIIEPEYTPTTSYRILLIALFLSMGFLSFTILQPAEKLGWVPVKTDYQKLEDVVPVKATSRVPIFKAAVSSPQVHERAITADTVPEVQEREFYFYESDTVDWADRFDVVVPEIDYDFDMESFVVAVPDVDWESIAPVFNSDSLFIYMDNIPEMDVDVFVVPEIELSEMNFPFAPQFYSIDTTKLSEAERKELRQAQEELRRAREEIRQLQREHKDRIREEMEKVRELQRREWDIQRDEMKRMQEELREQFGDQEAVISREKQQEIMREMRRAQAEMREVNREMSRRMTEESGWRQRQIQEEMRRAQHERARAQSEIAVARQEMRTNKGFQNDVENMLRKDGYLEEGESLRKLKINGNSFRYNGKKVDARDLDKYLKLYERRFGSLKGTTYEYSE